MAKSITEQYDDLLADCDRLKYECGTLHRRLEKLGEHIKHQQRMRDLLLRLSDPDLPEALAKQLLQGVQEMVRERESRA